MKSKSDRSVLGWTCSYLEYGSVSTRYRNPAGFESDPNSLRQSVCHHKAGGVKLFKLTSNLVCGQSEIENKLAEIQKVVNIIPP